MLSFKKYFVTGSVLSFGVCSLISTCYSQSEMGGRMEEKLPTREYVEPSEKISFMGLSGGASIPVDNFGTTPEMGVSIGAHPDKGVGFGAELNTTRLDDIDKNQRTILLGQAAYKIGEDIPVAQNSYIAIGAGPAIVKTQVKWAVSPSVGFDIPLTNKVHDVVSLGLNAKYTGVTSSPDAYVGSAIVKYWY